MAETGYAKNVANLRVAFATALVGIDSKYLIIVSKD